MEVVWITLSLGVLVAGWVWLHRQRKGTTATALPRPPVVPGLPWLGSALQLGAGGAKFLDQCRKQHGDTFTLIMAGQPMTFIFSPPSILHFFKAPHSELAFAPAVEQFTHRVFQLPPEDFISKHHLMLTTLRHKVGVRETLTDHATRLLPLLIKGIASIKILLSNKNPNSRIELFQAVKDLMFPTAVEALFGGKFLEHHGAKHLQEAFFSFDQCFEMAASPIPHIFQPSFRAARKALLTALQNSYAAGHFEGTAVDALIKKCGLPERSMHNMLLAVLWASQANTVPTAFWATAFLLLPENTSFRDSVRLTVLGAEGSVGSEGVTTHGSSGSNGNLSETQLKRLVSQACDADSLLVLCCLEALRLRSPSIDVRVAAMVNTPLPCWRQKDYPMNQEESSSASLPPPDKLFVDKNSVVALCPWLSHLDERLFPEPQVFNPLRGGICLPGAEGRGMHAAVAGVGGVGGVAFGGGRYRCPGRLFAGMEMALVVGLLVCSLDFKLEVRMSRGGDKVGVPSPGDHKGLLPVPDTKRLVGVKVPTEECWVELNMCEEGPRKIFK